MKEAKILYQHNETLRGKKVNVAQLLSLSLFLAMSFYPTLTALDILFIYFVRNAMIHFPLIYFDVPTPVR